MNRLIQGQGFRVEGLGFALYPIAYTLSPGATGGRD